MLLREKIAGGEKKTAIFFVCSETFRIFAPPTMHWRVAIRPRLKPDNTPQKEWWRLGGSFFRGNNNEALCFYLVVRNLRNFKSRQDGVTMVHVRTWTCYVCIFF